MSKAVHIRREPKPKEMMLSDALEYTLSVTSISCQFRPTDTTSFVSHDQYRKLELRRRSVFDQNSLRFLLACRFNIEDKSRVLNLLRHELSQYFRNDKTFSASRKVSGEGGSSSIDAIIYNLVIDAIVRGPMEVAKTFYAELACDCINFREFFLLDGIRINEEIQLFDGIYLTPLSNSADTLPGFLPETLGIFNDNIMSWLGKTVLVVKKSISPILLIPDKSDKSSFPSILSKFKVKTCSTDAEDFSPESLFLALTLGGNHPVFQKAVWSRIDWGHPFDLGMMPGYSGRHDNFAVKCGSEEFSREQVERGIDFLYTDKWTSIRC